MRIHVYNIYIYVYVYNCIYIYMYMYIIVYIYMYIIIYIYIHMYMYLVYPPYWRLYLIISIVSWFNPNVKMFESVRWLKKQNIVNSTCFVVRSSYPSVNEQFDPGSHRGWKISSFPLKVGDFQGRTVNMYQVSVQMCEYVRWYWVNWVSGWYWLIATSMIDVVNQFNQWI